MTKKVGEAWVDLYPAVTKVHIILKNEGAMQRALLGIILRGRS